jgi:hypothetical protein
MTGRLVARVGTVALGGSMPDNTLERPIVGLKSIVCCRFDIFQPAPSSICRFVY